jgi:transcriptional regulator with XRE-family HTH domain
MTPEALKASAAALGLSGRGLARELGVNEKTYRRWIKGTSRIPRTVELACQALLTGERG